MRSLSGWFPWPKLSRQELTDPRAKSEDYQSRVVDPGAIFHWEDRPPFSMITAELMLFDHKVTLALAIRNGLLAQMEIEVVGGPPGIREYVQRQWERVWTAAGEVMCESKHSGWVGFEPMFSVGDSASPDAGRSVFSGYRDFHPRDIRPLVSDGKVCGLTVNGCKENAQKLSLFNPKGVWLTYRDRYSSHYGQSLLQHAYAPWHEKWQRGGAIKLRQLRMMKDAWRGDVIRYPEGRKTTTPGGQVMSWRDVGREMLQLVMAGGIMGFPSTRTSDGKNYEWDYTPPTAVEGATQIHEYKKELDTEIVEGLEVPGEVLQTTEGSSSLGDGGRSIPMVGLLASLQREAQGIVGQIDDQLIRPLVRYDYACEPSYTIKVKPLIKTIFQLMREGDGGEGDGGGKPTTTSVFGGFGMPKPGGSPQNGAQSAVGYGAQQMSANSSRARACSKDRLSPRKAHSQYGSTVGGVYYRPGVWIEAEAMRYATDGELLQLSGNDGDGSHWITIGGRSGAGGEHVGGFPVKLDKDGNIIAGGPAGMRGLHVSKSGGYFKEQRAKTGGDRFDDVADFFDVKRGETTTAVAEAKGDYAARGPGNTRSLKKIVAYQAEKWGMDEATYQSFIDDAWKETLAFNQSREEFKKHAREETGLDAAKLRSIEERGGKRGRGGDSTDVKNLDTSAEALRAAYPQFFSGKGDAAEELFDLIREGRVEPLSRTSREFHDKIDEQLESLMAKAGEDYTPEPSDAEPVGAGFDEELGFSGEIPRNRKL